MNCIFRKHLVVFPFTELDLLLSRKLTRGMGETVTRALSRVCDINNFNKYDVDSKKVLAVCKHIKGRVHWPNWSVSINYKCIYNRI